MVDALEAVRAALRPGGLLVDLQPDTFYQPTVAVRDDDGRREVGRVHRDLDEDVVAAHAARRRVVSAGRLDEIAFFARAYRTRQSTLAAFDVEKGSHTPPWRLDRGVRPRLLNAWRARGEGAVIETTRRLTVAVLRKPTPELTRFG